MYSQSNEQIAIVLEMWETKIEARKEMMLQYFIPYFMKTSREKKFADLGALSRNRSKDHNQANKAKYKELAALEYVTVVPVNEIRGKCKLLNVGIGESEEDLKLIRNVKKSRDQYYYKCSRIDEKSNLLKNTPRTEELSQEYLFKAMQNLKQEQFQDNSQNYHIDNISSMTVKPPSPVRTKTKWKHCHN